MTWNFLAGALGIFALRLLNNSIGTINVIATVRQQRLLAAVLSFVESLIWVIAVASIIKDLANWVYLVAYCGGFALGSTVGIMIEARFVASYVNATIIAQAKGPEIAAALRHRGYGVTVSTGEGRDGAVTLLHSTLARRDMPDLLRVIHTVNAQAFVSVEPVRTVEQGRLSDEEQ
jgi:uncharacterized protein YebE (UPF0316 family)